MSYLKIKNVSKVYKEEKNYYQALKEINIEFNKGEFVAILGPSGCGKSTLLNLIMGISETTKGNIYVDGTNIGEFKNKRMDRYRKKEIGVIFQKYNLINSLNCFENVDINKNENIDKDDIYNMFNKMKLSKKIKSKIKECSGGEIQRIASIRALVNNPPILILDEPTGALDEENSINLMDYIYSIKDNKLVLFVTHNKTLAKKYATRIIEMKDGRIVKDSLNNAKIDVENSYNKYNINTKINIKYKLKYLLNTIFKKKGRFIMSVFASTFLLFFLSMSIFTTNISKEFIEKSFLNSLDANIIDIKSYVLVNKEIKEEPMSSLIINSLIKDERFELRKNYNEVLNKRIKPYLSFNDNNKKINLESLSLKCYSSYNNIQLIKGQNISRFNEVIINENLYNYLFNETRNVLNKRFYYEDSYLIIRGVSSSSFLNDSLTIYFNYNFVMEKFKEEKINTYQIDIKDIKEIDSIIKTLKKSNFYKELKEINDNKLSYTLKYSNDLENYYVFYELINIINVIIYFFLALSILISITLLSNIIYSFNEEEKVNLGLFRILGFSKFSVYSLNFYLSLIISFISLVIIIFINNYIINNFKEYLSDLLNFNVCLEIKNYQYIVMIIIILFLTFISSFLSSLKLNKMRLDNVIKED